MSENTNKTNPVKFNVGDRVKIVKEVTARTSDFQNSWVKSMSDNIGSTFTIKSISKRGIYFEGESLGYPPASLVKVSFSSFDELFKYMKHGGYVLDELRANVFICYRIKKGVLEINSPDLSEIWEKSLYNINDIQEGVMGKLYNFTKRKYSWVL